MKTLILITALFAPGPCWGQGNATVRSAPKYVWEPVQTKDSRTQYALLKDGKHVGSWDEKGRFYRPRLGPGKWGAVGKPPIGPPKFAVKKAPVANYGVKVSEIGKGPQYARDGKSCSKQEALEGASGGEVPTDAGKPFLTVIGSESERKAVLDDLAGHAALVGVKEAYRLQAYTPDNWAVARYGFKTSGTPTIYCQAASGEVLHRQDDYQGGAQALATALRKIDPLYKPDADPDKRKPEPVLPGMPAIPMPAYVLAGAAGLLILLRPRAA